MSSGDLSSQQYPLVPQQNTINRDNRYGSRSQSQIGNNVNNNPGGLNHQGNNNVYHGTVHQVYDSAKDKYRKNPVKSSIVVVVLILGVLTMIIVSVYFGIHDGDMSSISSHSGGGQTR